MSILGSTSGRVAAYLRAHTNPPVFLISAAVILTFLVVVIAFPDATMSAREAIQGTETTPGWIAEYFRWFYILSVTALLVFVLVVMISRYGRLRLGPPGSTPQYGTLSWLSMLFTAGMGVGLVYAGVNEPVQHLREAPISAPRQSEQAATEAMNFTFYHWGLHGWAMYTVFGLALGYLCYRKGLPLRPASVLYPLLGDRIHGWPGKLVDILAVSVTVVGLATSLGLGALAINAGFNEAGTPEPPNIVVTLLIAALITAVAATSLMLGIFRGMRRLSVTALLFTALFLAFVFLMGPTLYLLRSLPDYTGFYLRHFLWTSVTVYDPSNADGTWTTEGRWQAAWTLFNWGWWLSWAPFVGMFLAKISQGRTIRQFIAATLFVPSGICLVWFSIFGGTALYQEQHGGLKKVDPGAVLDILTPGAFSALSGVVVILLVLLFFGPSLDAASQIVSRITSRSDQDDDQEPATFLRLGWVLSAGVVAAVLLFAGWRQSLESKPGEAAEQAAKVPLEMLQAAAVTAGIPIAVLLLLACVGLVSALRTARE